MAHLERWKRGNVAGPATFTSEVGTIIRGGLFLVERLKEWPIGLPRARFTIWGMIEAVAAVAILLTAISFPPAAPAIFGFSGAVVVHLVVLRSEQFEASCPAFGFAVGAAIGIFFYFGSYPAAWVARYSVACTIAPAMVITLVVLGLHHARQKQVREPPQDKTCLGTSSDGE